MTFSTTQVRTLARILREAAQAEILPRFRKLAARAIRQKSSRLDIVTDADEAAEELIANRLRTAFPEALIIGEEAASRDPSLLERLCDASLAFVVDPIDGTKNFSAGLPLFGVMAGVIQEGTVVAGVIYDPVVDDWAIGLRGEGAWLEQLNGQLTDLHVSQAPPLREMLGIVSWLFMPEPLKSTVTANLSRVAGAADYRTAAHEYRLISGGHYDFAMFGKLMPWDHAAGCLIHHEAGGYSARFNGESYLPTNTSGGLLCAPDKESWTLLRDALIGDAAAVAEHFA